MPIRERSGLAIFLLSAGTAGWNAGNVGPVVAPLSDEFSVSLAAVGLLAGVGFSLPYPLFYDEGERVLPDRPLAGLGLLQVGSNAFPIVAIPLIGEALSDGRQELAFLSLAGLVAVTALLSLGPGPAASAAEPVSPPSARPG